MEFLPISLSGVRVYAGFWKRFGAGIIDIIIILLFIYLCNFFRLSGSDKDTAVIITILYTTILAIYNVFFTARFGGTLGKLAVGIRITKPDGSSVGWPEAWKRNFVDLLFMALFLYFSLFAIAQMDIKKFSGLGFYQRNILLSTYYPAWFGIVRILEQVWYWGELIVLLFNKRKRAIHDFIAGTVVIHKRFTEQTDSAGLSTNSAPGDYYGKVPTDERIP